MKRYLLTMGSLLGVALIAGIVVWFLYQDIGRVTQGDLDALLSAKDRQVPPAYSEKISEEQLNVFTIDSLTEDQRNILQLYGRVNITEQILRCAGDALGHRRLEEILNGSAPSPLEAQNLHSCMDT